MILFFSVMIVASLTMAFTYVPNKIKREPYTLRRSDKCFVSNETVCDTHAVSQFYFWNLTNAEAVIAGSEAPNLVEVGPYVLSDGKEKKSDITFQAPVDASYSNSTLTQEFRPASVSYVATSYARWDHSSFCDGCELTDTIISFNPAYATLVAAYGSEVNFLYSLTPKVLTGVIGGIVSVFEALAVSHAASLPHIAAAANAGDTGDALYSLAVMQWADCSILGGASLVDIGLPAEVLASFPVAPEIGKYVATATSGAMTGFAATEASAILKFLTEYDVSGIAVLGFLSADTTVGAGMVESYASAINITASITATHALLTKGYVDSITRSYGKGAASAAIGPFLDPTSSGMFIARPVGEWVMGYVDPLTSSRYPSTDPRHLVRAVTKTFLHDDLGLTNASTAVDRVPREVTDKSQWPGLGATPWVLATGADDASRTSDVLEATGGSGITGSNDVTEYSYEFGNETVTEAVRGKYAARAVYRSVKDKTAEGNPDVLAWFDFGSSLDFGRAVKLEFEGSTWFAHEEVELHKFRVSRDALLPCPVSTTNCVYNSDAYGGFNVTSHRSIPTVTTMPHGLDTDPRLWGFVDPLEPVNSTRNPFKPDANKHQIEWDVFEMSGDVLGMRLRYQNNFLVSPTDIFYPNLWKPSSDSNAFDASRGTYIPIAWCDVSWAAPQSAIDDIAAIIKEATGLTIVYMIGLPGASFIFVVYHSCALYIKRRVARGQKQVRDEINAQRLLSNQQTSQRSEAYTPLAETADGPPPLGPSVVEKSNKDDYAYPAEQKYHDDDASVVVVDVHGRR